MIRLNDYLYSGDTVLSILHDYSSALKAEAIEENNPIDMVHSNFLLQLTGLLENAEFLTSQSHRILELYKYMAQTYPELSFTLKGRIKALIRAEAKFNAYVIDYIYGYYQKNHAFPNVAELKQKLTHFRDLLAYRFVISLPRVSVKPGETKEEAEKRYLYEIAEMLPAFFEERGFTAEPDNTLAPSSRLSENVSCYYRDYVEHPTKTGYQSLHITLYDNIARCHIEVQLRTKTMDDHAEIGAANHLGYESRQKEERDRKGSIPIGACSYFDEAFERMSALQELDLKSLDVDMFTALDDKMVNDGCGLYRGRLILPYEHLAGGKI